MTRQPAALVAVAAAAAGLFALVALGVVPTPDLDGALTDLSDTLGTWTYALVGGLAFLETGAFVGLIAPARRRSCSAGWSRRAGASTSRRCC